MSELIERLRGYNPPDRTVDEQRSTAQDIHDAADALERAEQEVTSLRARVSYLEDEVRKKYPFFAEAERESAECEYINDEIERIGYEWDVHSGPPMKLIPSRSRQTKESAE